MNTIHDLTKRFPNEKVTTQLFFYRVFQMSFLPPASSKYAEILIIYTFSSFHMILRFVRSIIPAVVILMASSVLPKWFNYSKYSIKPRLCIDIILVKLFQEQALQQKFSCIQLKVLLKLHSENKTFIIWFLETWRFIICSPTIFRKSFISHCSFFFPLKHIWQKKYCFWVKFLKFSF